MLVQYLCVEHIDYALELGLQGTFYSGLIFLIYGTILSHYDCS